MRIPVAILTALMLLTGSLNTIATKIQDKVVVGEDEHGNPIHFQHPFIQTFCMFLGESLCLIPYFIKHFIDGSSSPRNTGLTDSTRDSKALIFRRTIFAFTIPAICDLGATTLLNLGLYYTLASVFQMLRGTLCLFAGFLTIFILKRRLRSHNWLGITFITAGAALVGASSIIYSKQDQKKDHTSHSESSSAPDPLIGNSLVIAAQLLNALQFILEEKFLRQLHPPVLLAVGSEGAVGLLGCLAALPLISCLRFPSGAPVDDIAAGIQQIARSYTLQWSTAATVLSIAAFNFCGVTVTKRLSGTARAAIDACRTALIWLYCLRVGWEKFHYLQAVGFGVLIAGTSIYNDILRSCLPSAEEEIQQHRHTIGRGQRDHHHHHQRRHHSSTGDGDEEQHAFSSPSSSSAAAVDVEEPLLMASERGYDDDFHHTNTDDYDDDDDNKKKTKNTGYNKGIAGAGYTDTTSGTSHLLPAPTASNPSENSQQQQQQRNHTTNTDTTNRNRNGGQSRPKSSESKPLATAVFPASAEMTMARTFTMLPGAFSPHSLASVPSDWNLLASSQSLAELGFAARRLRDSDSGSSSSSSSSNSDGCRNSGGGDGIGRRRGGEGGDRST